MSHQFSNIVSEYKKFHFEETRIDTFNNVHLAKSTFGVLLGSLYTLL